VIPSLKFLLDTSVFIWASLEPNRLSARTQQVLKSSYDDRFVSVVTLWEMQIKHSLRKLPLPSSVDKIAGAWMQALGADLLPIEIHHLGHLYGLSNTHKDPFDRMLIAQALSEGMQIVSPDKMLQAYNVPIVW
jgi:PIN domain nuclease of toxin-antitoxin system